MAVLNACSGPASTPHRGSRPSTLSGFRSATVAAIRPPRDEPQSIVFFTPRMAPLSMAASRFSFAWTPSGVAQPCAA
jgi:hypothetical protein